MRTEIHSDAEAVAVRAAAHIAGDARAAIAARGWFACAVSGGRTPWTMLGLLAGSDLDWRRIHLFQVDERVAPDGDGARNWTSIRRVLIDRVPLPPTNAHPMPVTAADLEAAARSYAAELAACCGTPAVLDLIALGLGDDGHTASLVPGDPVLAVTDRDVATTHTYRGHRRMTLTYPALDRARSVLWVVTGAEKAAMAARLRDADRAIPAGRVCRNRAILLADAAAAGPGATPGQ